MKLIYEKVFDLLEEHDRRQEFARMEFRDKAEAAILVAAQDGSKKSSISLTTEEKAQVAWLRQEWRGHGVSMSIEGDVLHFTVGYPRTRRKPNEDEYNPRSKSKDEYAY